MNIEITNLTSECFLNHKKDKIYKKYVSFTSIINVYLTKSYKIIRIDNFNSSIVIDVFQFCELLLKCYLKFKTIYFNKNNIKFFVNHNLRTFELQHKKLFFLKLNYSKCKVILKDLIHLYKSHIINATNFIHVDNKKKEIDNILKHFKFLKIDSNILNNMCFSKRLLSDNSNILFDKNICKKLLLFYFFCKV
jgi:hypothetical protein